jgi:hypothetical protein
MKLLTGLNLSLISSWELVKGINFNTIVDAKL